MLLLRIIDHNSSRKIGEWPIILALSAKKKPKQKQNVMCVRITLRIMNRDFVQLINEATSKC